MIEDKDQQDRRSAQRDVQEKANGSRITIGKSIRDRETKTKENGAVRGNPWSYQHGRREEGGTRLSDNSAEADRPIGSSRGALRDRNIEKSMKQRDENGDRYEESEKKPIIREYRKKKSKVIRKKERRS